VNLVTASQLLNYAIISFTYLKFYYVGAISSEVALCVDTSDRQCKCKASLGNAYPTGASGNHFAGKLRFIMYDKFDERSPYM
jgi:hypothetical protein